MTELLFDGALCLLILAVAVTSVAVRDPFTGIVFFIVYGLLVAIAWTRLEAVDVALAEAAIGAGLTGVLFVGAMSRMERAARAEAQRPAHAPFAATAVRIVLCAGATAGIAAAFLSLPDHAPNLRPLAEQNLHLTGVANPVTAVLINFRGYDTLLETVVLLIALIGVWSLAADRFWGGAPGAEQQATPQGVLAYFGRVLPPVGLLLGAYLVWTGSSAPGGAFQGGTVLAGVLLLVWMAGLGDAPRVTSAPLRLVLIAGPAVFLVIGIVGALLGSFLGLHPPMAKTLTLAIEFALAGSIAATLALLVAGPPRLVA